jgi:hypothetical protein
MADTIVSPVRRVDVNDWVYEGDTTAADGGDVYIAL